MCETYLVTGTDDNAEAMRMKVVSRRNTVSRTCKKRKKNRTQERKVEEARRSGE